MKNKKTLLILAVLFIISFAYTKLCKKDSETKIPAAFEGNLTVSFLEAGQGDSEFVEFPGGKCMLIDASIKDMGDDIVDYIRSRGYDKIDYAVATHPHADHIGGMQQVVENFEIGTFYMPEAVTTTKIYTDLLNTLKKKGISVKKAKNGVSFSENGAEIEFLSPVSDDYDDLNNWSAVMKITFGESEFLFTGDAEELVEKELLEINADVQADVLKVGHHGSNTSSSEAFIREVNPQIAVIECGKDNEYGHPHKEVTELFNRLKVKIYRTDIDGTVIVTSDGKEEEVL